VEGKSQSREGINLHEQRKDFLVFHYTEKIKSSLIVASSLLDFLENLKEQEIVGAEKLLKAYFNALMLEVSIAVNATKMEELREIIQKLQKALEEAKTRNYDVARRLISEAISMATTQGSRSAETLKAMGLI
jgi:predicted GTPase